MALRSASVALICVSAFALTLTGCALNSLPVAESTVTGLAIRGEVHGGYQPLTGAHIYLMAASTGGYGSASTSLLTSGDGTDSTGTYVLTTSGGNFNITGDYTCTTGQQVYLLATGGNPGLPAATYSTIAGNTAATLMVAFGSCPSGGSFAGQIPFVTVNEVSTVAAAYALAGFIVDPTHIAAANTPQSMLGLVNAFANIPNIVSLNYGQAYTTTPAVMGYSSTGLSANGTVPLAKIYTLADVAASCVNSSGPASTACTTFFTNTPNSSNIKPTDVFTALINLAHNPANTFNFTSLATSVAPFQPTLTVAPTDWALNVKFVAPNTSTPGRPAIDAAGNVWVPNVGNNSLTEFSPQGVVYSGTTGFTGSGMNQPDQAAIDTSGNVWVSNYASGTASEFNSTGIAASASGYTTQNGPSYGVAVTPVNTWFVGANSISGLTPAGTVAYRGTASTNNAAVTIDPNGIVWTAAYALNQVAASYVPILGGRTLALYTATGLTQPAGISSDASGTLWVANSGANTVTRLVTGLALGIPLITSSTPTTAGTGGIVKPYFTAVDGAGTIWVGNSNGSLSNLTAGAVALSNSNGYTTPSTASYTAQPTATMFGFLPAYGIYGLAIDPSGNVWASDVDGSLYQFLGLAAPTRTPLSYNNTGVRP